MTKIKKKDFVLIYFFNYQNINKQMIVFLKMFKKRSLAASLK